MIRVFESAAGAALAAAGHLARAASAAIAARGAARVGLSGGTTPEPVYRALAAPPLRDEVRWERVEILFADERAVGPEDRDSNYRLVRETLLAGLPAPGPHAVRMRADAEPPHEALEEYERALAAPLDLLLLGVGADGHTASLFPGSLEVRDLERRVAVVDDSPRPPARRMTILPRVIAEARAVIVLVTGSAKARAVARALEQAEVDPAACPAALARGRAWYLDREAAAGLSRS
jgi:6-phosphogluconolactonase